MLQDWYTDTQLIYSGTDTLPIIYDPNTGYSIFDPDKSLFHYSDYDNDSDDEVCISTKLNFFQTRLFNGYSLDKENHQLILEHMVEYNWIHESSPHYPMPFQILTEIRSLTPLIFTIIMKAIQFSDFTLI